MLFKIPLLTALIFSALYPLCFWISAQDPLKNNFHRFHIGAPSVVGGIAAIIVLFSDTPQTEKTLVLLWIASLLFTAFYYWNKPTVAPLAVTFCCILGTVAFLRILSLWVPLNIFSAATSILGGLILCAALFCMNLGHWYLNVPGLDIKHLQNSVYIFWGLTALRALADIVLLFATRVLVQWETVSLYRFLMTMDGFLLIIALLFGTLLPLVTLYYVKGTLEVKSTQSATGILYAILCGVLIGDITYKYYLLKFGIAL